MANAGFHHDAVIERDHYACETFRQNQHHHVNVVDAWPVHEVDARKFDYNLIAPGVSVVSGGPPCQPFSMGGKHQAQQDERNMFPEAIRAIRELTPSAFIFENVKGLTRASFSQYLSYIKLQLEFPNYTFHVDEDWCSHFSRLEPSLSVAWSSQYTMFGRKFLMRPTMVCHKNVKEYFLLASKKR